MLPQHAQGIKGANGVACRWQETAAACVLLLSSRPPPPSPFPLTSSSAGNRGGNHLLVRLMVAWMGVASRCRCLVFLGSGWSTPHVASTSRRPLVRAPPWGTAPLSKLDTCCRTSRRRRCSGITPLTSPPPSVAPPDSQLLSHPLELNEERAPVREAPPPIGAHLLELDEEQHERGQRQAVLNGRNGPTCCGCKRWGSRRVGKGPSRGLQSVRTLVYASDAWA